MNFDDAIHNQSKLNTLCYSADNEGIAKFLEQNKSLDVNYNKGWPIIMAIRSIEKYPPSLENDRLESVKTLVAAGADIHINDDMPMYWAVTLDNHIIVDYLLKMDDYFMIDRELVDDYRVRNNSLHEELCNRLVQATPVLNTAQM